MGISLSDPQVWASLLTLTVMEIVLGIDNIVFISVVVSKLKGAKRVLARQIGLALALIFRIALLLALTWLIAMRAPVFEIFGQEFSWRDLILIGGGLFLLVKATLEIHDDIEDEEDDTGAKATTSFMAVIAQVVVVDMVFSVDSIVTAIGMAEHVEIMIAAVVISMIVMYFASGPIANFIEEYPTTKMLALSFLMLIGMSLIADGFQVHIPREYIYFAMSFSVLVEFLNVMAKRKRQRDRQSKP